MPVYALVLDEGRRRLASAGMRGANVQCLPSVAAAIGALSRAASGGVFVLDPAVAAVAHIEKLVRTADANGFSVLLYAGCHRECAARIFAVARLVVTDVLFHGAIDEQATLRRLTERVGAPTVPALLLTLLASRLAELPEEIGASVLSMFGWRPLPTSAGALVGECPKYRRSSERACARAGFVGVLRLLDGVRLARAWECGPEHRTLALVAQHAGYSRERLLAEHSQRYLGISLRRGLRTLAPQDVANRIARRMVRAAVQC